MLATEDIPTILIILACFSVILGIAYLRGEVRLTWLMYIISYSVTTTVGAVLIADSYGNDYLRYKYNLDTSRVDSVVGFDYWALLLSPYIFVTAALMLISRVKIFNFHKSLNMIGKMLSPNRFAIAFLVTSILIFYEIFLLILSGMGDLSSAVGGTLEYEEMIINRTKMMGGLSGVFGFYYEILYVCLPFMSWISVYFAVAVRKKRWIFLLFIQMVSVLMFCLLSLQKAPLLTYGLGLTYALFSAGVLNFRRLLAGAGIGLFALTSMQSQYVLNWSFMDSLHHVVFRIASSFPYYIDLYGNHAEYLELYLGLGLFGIGVTLSDTISVFEYMYPDVVWVVGHAAAAAHVRAYSHGGMPAATLAIIWVAVIIIFAKSFRIRHASALGFAMFIQLGITSYYLTQTSLRGALIESYGLRWVVIPIVLCVIAKVVLGTKGRRLLDGVLGIK